MTTYFTKDGDELIEVAEPLHTQTDVDKIVKDRAERIARQQFGDYEDLKAKAGQVDTIKTDYETKLGEATSKATELEKALGSAKLETEKVKVIHEFKLPKELHEFVSGDTPEDLRAKAEKLSKGVTGGKVTVTKQPKPDSGKSDNKALAGKLFGTQSND